MCDASSIHQIHQDRGQSVYSLDETLDSAGHMKEKV